MAHPPQYHSHHPATTQILPPQWEYYVDANTGATGSSWPSAPQMPPPQWYGGQHDLLAAQSSDGANYRNYHSIHNGQHHQSQQGDEDNDNMYWAAGMVLLLIGANVLAVWCERQMSPDESFLQGLGTANRRPSRRINDDNHQGGSSEGSVDTGDDDGGDDRLATTPGRRTTRIVHLRW